MITISCSSRYRVERKKIKDAVGQILKDKGVSPLYDVNIIFVGRNKMRFLTKKYKHEEETLPILTFSYWQEEPPRFDNSNEDRTSEVKIDKLLGEIFICYPQAVLLAAQRNKKVDEIIKSLINHGIENLLK